MNKQIYKNIFSFDLEFFRQNKTLKWGCFYTPSLFCVATFTSLLCCLCLFLYNVKSLCLHPFFDNTADNYNYYLIIPLLLVRLLYMQYSSMTSKSTVSETSFLSAGFESSAGLETKSSYCCRALVYRVR